MNTEYQDYTLEQQPAIPDNLPVLLEGNELKEATNRLAQEVQAKIRQRQQEVPTAFDYYLDILIEQLHQLDKDLPWEESSKHLSGTEGERLRQGLQQLRLFLSRRSQGRFVSFHERFTTPEIALGMMTDIGLYEPAMSQGVAECMQWKGMPLFKTAFDFNIYTMMLWDIKPRTIIELGSGVGSSAIWLADLMKIFEIQGHIFSVDLKKLELQHNGVSFIQGDCNQIEEVFAEDFLRNAPHPWLFIEDAHVNVHGVLCHFHRYFKQGDYVVIEESLFQKDAIGRFLMKYPDCYKIDTYYTDFFGGNITCAMDSIFVRN
ncbi:hypothetical protein WA1_43730 [Scytonema hofmannii PCC 7110]|uniref:Uncharacterized protein n=1 Tax=Scytonema hofmannii PCC 7110 TaxID=128403 RepID=A0A139WVY9_9CYAN|nr:CmcI family methyltransferase [Scytonema hofmannii]KYC36600.1 hypothetical protein WA1_43730 [Scytonema hofmannii PCC 7110]